MALLQQLWPVQKIQAIDGDQHRFKPEAQAAEKTCQYDGLTVKLHFEEA